MEEVFSHTKYVSDSHRFCVFLSYSMPLSISSNHDSICSLKIKDTSAGSRTPKFTQPLGKVGLVNLGNSCFMNSALRALYCSSEFKNAVLNSTQKYVSCAQ